MTQPRCTRRRGEQRRTMVQAVSTSVYRRKRPWARCSWRRGGRLEMVVGREKEGRTLKRQKTRIRVPPCLHWVSVAVRPVVPASRAHCSQQPRGTRTPITRFGLAVSMLPPCSTTCLLLTTAYQLSHHEAIRPLFVCKLFYSIIYRRSTSSSRSTFSSHPDQSPLDRILTHTTEALTGRLLPSRPLRS